MNPEVYHVLEFDEILQRIASLAHFSLGKKQILESEPLMSRLKLQRENQLVGDALAICVRYGMLPFGGVRDVSSALIKSKKQGIVSVEEAVHIGRLGHAVKAMNQFMDKVELKVDSVRDVLDSVVVSSTLTAHIDRCFSYQYEVLDQASPELSSIRSRLRKMDEKISRAVNQFMSANAAHLTDTVTTLRHDRTVVMVRVSDKNKFKGVIHGESASGQTAFVEPDFLLALNNEKQMLISMEEEEIERILIDVTQRIALVADQYLANVETLGKLDAVFAKGQWGKLHDGVMTTIADEGIHIKYARHPLIDPKTVVSNTYRLLPPYHMLLITGPNTGGKTVSLKILGLFTLMSYCSIPVLAEEASIQLFDQLFVDIGDDQSIAQSLSTFSSHLSKIARITQHCTSSSLVLLDELGGGTDPMEGESLAMGILDFLRTRQVKTVATTHYNRLKVYATEHPEILLASVSFDLEKLQPTYRYVEGLAGQSYALDIAKRFEIPMEIIDYSLAMKEKGKTDQQRLLEQLELAIAKQKRVEEELLQKEVQLNQSARSLETMKLKFEQEKEQLLEEAKQKADGIVNELFEEAMLYLEQLKESEKPHQRIEAMKKLEELSSMQAEVVKDADIVVGDQVQILSTHQLGEVVEIRGNQVSVTISGKLFRVKKNQIAKAKVKKAKKTLSRSSVSSAMTAIALECNVIGLRVDEALVVVDKYVDDCVLHRIKTARIIHGHGTGALRTAIWQKLKNHASIQELRLGGQGEGGVGATVIVFKG